MSNVIDTDRMVYVIEMAEESISQLKSKEAEYLKKILESLKDDTSS